MFSFNLVRWLKSLYHARRKPFEKKPRVRLRLEELETRLAPATHTWSGAGGNTLWSNPGNWSSGGIPSAASPLDDVIFPASVPAAQRIAQNDIPNLVLNSLQINASTYTLSEANALDFVTLGSPTVSGSGTVLVGPGAAGDVISMNLQLAGPTANQQFFTVNSSASLTISGQISGTTGSQLTKEGTGTLALTGNNAGFLGPVTIPSNAGIVSISTATALGSPVVSTVETATLTTPVANTTQFTLTFNGQSTASLTYTGTPADAATVQTALNSLGSIGGIGGSVTVVETGTTFKITFGGTLANLPESQIFGAITAGGGGISSATTLVGGTTSNIVTVGNNSQLQINGGAGIGPINNPLFLSGTGISNDGALLNVAGSNTWSGNVQLVTDADLGQNAGVLTITGVISDAGAGQNLTKVGVGQLILTNADTYRGSTSIDYGILTIENPLALGANPAAGTFVNANSTTGQQGSLQLNYTGTVSNGGFTVPNEALYLYDAGFINGAIDNLAGNNAWSGNIVLEPLLVGGVLNAVNVNFSVDGTSSLLVTGVLSDDPTRPAGGAIGKTGTGNLILEPTNPNTGNGTPNTFGDRPNIFTGTVTLEDSQGLGLTTKTVATTVFSGASLHLQSNVGHVDSVTASTTHLQLDDPINIIGDGTPAASEGAPSTALPASTPTSTIRRSASGRSSP